MRNTADIRQWQQQKRLVEGGYENQESEGGEGEVEGQVEDPTTKKKRKQRKKEHVKEAGVVAGAASKREAGDKPEKHEHPFLINPKEATIGVKDDKEAEEIQLHNFNFKTFLTSAPSLPQNLDPTETSKSLQATSAEQRADQRARLAARIEALRTKRRADSPEGTPARNRHELMAARRREEALQRKGRKREIRLHEKTIVEQTKATASSPEKNSLSEKGEKDRQSQVGGKEAPAVAKGSTNINLLPDNKGSGKSRRMEVLKKSNSKKSRPGFEGSLKLGRKGKK